MTSAQEAGSLTFEAPGPGSYKQDPVHFPRPVTRYWTEIHPAAFKRGTTDFASFYGMLIDGLQTAYVNGFGYRPGLPGAGGGDPAALRSAPTEVLAGSSGASSSGSGTRPQAGRDREAPRDPGGRSRRALRRGAGRVPRPLPRPPRGDDHPAHALHRERGGPDGRLPRPRRRLDRPAAGRAARPHARRVAGLGRRVRRARAD